MQENRPSHIFEWLSCLPLLMENRSRNEFPLWQERLRISKFRLSLFIEVRENTFSVVLCPIKISMGELLNDGLQFNVVLLTKVSVPGRRLKLNWRYPKSHDLSTPDKLTFDMLKSTNIIEYSGSLDAILDSQEPIASILTMKHSILLLFLAISVAAKDIEYDYIIAGAGTAENPNITVAVLEAGTDSRTNPNVTIPELRGAIIGTEFDWDFSSVDQPGLFENRSQAVNRGKTIGGTSAMNWMIHNEDSRIQLDIWESLLNLTGWNWETLSTAFRESETFFASPSSSVLTYDAANHGGNGPICSTMQRSVFSLLSDYLEPTLRAAGYVIPQDRNGGNVTGASFLPLAICPQNYTRSYAGSAYTAVQARPNLRVLTNSQVTGIKWESTLAGNITAAGLKYQDGRDSNSIAQINAREIILSAGCIQSSQILELSGVGDPNILLPLGIRPVVNLSTVGTGLRDPPMMMYEPLQFNFSVNFTGHEYAQNFIQLEPARNILSPENFAAASTWLNSTASIPGLEDAQLQVFKHLWYTDQPLIEIAWQYSGNQAMPYALIPLSQGTTHINSSDPLAPPRIDPNYNTVRATIGGEEVDWDLWFLSKAAQYYVTQLATHAPFSDILTLTDPMYNLSAAEYQQAVFERMGTSQHLTGGNPMLPREAGGVVDSKMLVYGTRNVRVVDGSIFPYQPSAHPMGLTYAVAVRAARILQSLQGGQGPTYTDQLPLGNSSSNATATFPSQRPTATYDSMGSVMPPAQSISSTVVSQPAPIVNV
ncbi:GMC oxidoreductase [Aplosporella prunicola CBS 121167]|uniref:GMC oxidoreductase n=1 Tax=Aplosporella prunicola CBS 121167 TaxID=1176127 RepID=A0A6A6BJE6_9PEZI|nr:GMC oxidoreductase [Aplosporella prunicola CBS 121167]KAF2142691.1 GMC oxidoreductase [Aplosporella prunicola CBS 121167]